MFTLSLSRTLELPRLSVYVANWPYQQERYNPMTLSQATQLIPELPLKESIRTLAPATYTGDRVIVVSPGFMKNVSDLLSTTPTHTLQPYFLWRAITNYQGQTIAPDALKPFK